MARRPIPIKIKPGDLVRIEEILRSGVVQVRVVIRALALRQLAQGCAAPQVARALPLTAKAVRQIAHRYDSGGLDCALYDRERHGAKPLLDESQRQGVLAMVRGRPPEGRPRWTVRLAAEEAVRRKLVPRAGRETIRMLLQNHDLKPWRETV
ncbi:MAG: helix-turn-helix domain-containing protein [Bryobacteraceae bacterium]|jgi:putative transposase